MNKSENIIEIAKALCAVQSKLTGAKKETTNTFFKSSYADLESVWDSIRDLMYENGLSVSQFPCTLENNAPGLETILMHNSGQFISNTVPLISVKQDPQSYGSAITYFRRYALSAVIGQIQVDDDAQTSMGNQNQEPKHHQSSVKSTQANNSDNRYEGVTGKESRLVTDPQLKRLFAIVKKSGLSDADVKEMVSTFGVDSSKKLNQKQYDELVSRIEELAK